MSLYSIVSDLILLGAVLVMVSWVWRSRRHIEQGLGRVRQQIRALMELPQRHREMAVGFRRATDRIFVDTIRELRLAMRVFSLHLASCALSIAAGERVPYIEGEEGCTCQLQAVLEPLPEWVEGSRAIGFALVDPQGIIRFVANRFLLLSGYGMEIIGQHVNVLVPDRFRSHHGEWMAAYMANPQPRPIGHPRSEVFLLSKEGREVPVDLGLHPCYPEKDKSAPPDPLLKEPAWILIILRLRPGIPW